MSSIWDRVRQLEGTTLCTLHKSKPFTVVSVHTDCVRVVPEDGTGSERPIRRDRIEHMASLALQRDELRHRTQREYADSQNTSYIAAIVYEVSKQGEASVQR